VSRRTETDCDWCGRQSINLDKIHHHFKLDYGRGLRDIDLCECCWDHVMRAVRECKASQIGEKRY
jgi:hypothetical protein